MKIAQQDTARPRKLRASEPAILFAVSRQFFAIAADAVQEIRSTDSIAGASREFQMAGVPKVRHTLERGPRQYFVVNACVHFGLGISRPTLVLILRQLRVAVLVDRIERMTELPAVFELPLAFSGAERRWYRGLAYLNDHVIPVVDPRGFLTAEEFHLLDGASPTAAAPREMEGAASQ
jgi:chemotaxis signal transduction protein